MPITMTIKQSIVRCNPLQDLKKHIRSKINDIDLMLTELNIQEVNDGEKNKPEIDIETLDVVDVLHNILN